MRKFTLFLVALPLISLSLLTACGKNPSPAIPGIAPSKPEIIRPSTINDKLQTPSPQNDFSIDEINYMAQVINAMGRILKNEVIEITSEPMLSDTTYMSPKDGRKPISYASGRKRFIGEDHRGFGRRFAYNFRRDKNTSQPNSPWTEASAGTGETTYSTTLNLTPDFFFKELGLVFERAELTKTPEYQNKEANFFYFRSADEKLKYSFKARVDDSNIEDGYPKSFFDVIISVNHPDS